MERRATLSAGRLAFVAMLLAVVLVYLPPGVLRGDLSLLGFDYLMLHQHRIAFAREFLSAGVLPGWYPREFCGAPFWANVQNFPFIATRLLLLGLPVAMMFPAGVMLSALLSATFTFLLARRWNMGATAAAAAGWTFAASGFFASRVAAGHLPLLEAYPALPLLLWLVDRAADPAGARFDGRLFALGLATAALALAGHPQLWVYALMTAVAYAVVIAGRRSAWIMASMAAGLGAACFALYPMLLLIGRSTRVMPLDQASNDIAMPYARLLAAVAPWRDYRPTFDPAQNFAEFTSSAHASYFWDTVWYVGLLPWAAAAALVAGWITGRIRPGRRGWFLFAAGVGALLLALPVTRDIMPAEGATIFRSPARWIYVTGFALCLGCGFGVDQLLRLAEKMAVTHRRMLAGAAAVLLLAHGIDLGSHDRHFMVSAYAPRLLSADLEREVAARVGDGRAAVDLISNTVFARPMDDVRLFDSIILARSYRAFLAMKGAPPGFNTQWIPAFAIDARILRAWCAHVLITQGERKLPLVQHVDGLNVYAVEGSQPRAAFVAGTAARRMTQEQIDSALRHRTVDWASGALLLEGEPVSTGKAAPAGALIGLPVRRDRPDELHIELDATEAGYVRIAEAFDPGWHATIDGGSVAVEPANLMFMAVPVPPGRHVLSLRYHTPGGMTGLLLSGLGVAGSLLVAAASARWNRQASLAQELVDDRLNLRA